MTEGTTTAHGSIFNDEIVTGMEGNQHKPEFTGSGAEYFRIWIVNVLLSIVTLGIYSAWATVRNRRYFFGNTDLDGHRFDFHGDPRAILRGRLIAVLLFLLYAFGGEFHWSVPAATFVLILFGFPWILVRTLRFRLFNSSYRGLRFGFTATTEYAYRRLAIVIVLFIALAGMYLWSVWDMAFESSTPAETGLFFLAFFILMLIGLCLLPLFHYRMRDLTMNHITYGRHPFRADLRLGAFWKALGLSVLAFFAAIVVGMALGFAGAMVGGLIVGMTGELSADSNSFYWMIILVYVFMVPAYLIPFAAWHCVTNNYVVGQARLEDIKFNLELQVPMYWWILVSNAFAAVLTLGLAIPWTRVRMMRYRLSRMTVTGDLDRFLAGEGDEPGALGDEIGEAFDLDLGF